jgi:hypothetical protein
VAIHPGSADPTGQTFALSVSDDPAVTCSRIQYAWFACAANGTVVSASVSSSSRRAISNTPCEVCRRAP